MDHFNVDLLNAIGKAKVRHRISTSAVPAIFPPSLPVRVITFIPCARAASTALMTLAELPDVEIPNSTSPDLPTASR